MKNNHPRKLLLSRTALRKLSLAELDEGRGAGGVPTSGSSVATGLTCPIASCVTDKMGRTFTACRGGGC